MPWSPGYQTTAIGCDEARLVAFQSLLVGKIADLNTALQLAPISMPTGSATSGQILIGDTNVFPRAVGPFVVCILGGGRTDGMDMESAFKEIGLGVTVSYMQNRLHTRMRVYIHPDAIPAASNTWANVNTQAENRERLLSRVCDWIRADCLQVRAGVDLTLTSSEYTETGDNLTETRIVAIRKGRYEKGFDSAQICIGAEIQIASQLQ